MNGQVVNQSPACDQQISRLFTISRCRTLTSTHAHTHTLGVTDRSRSTLCCIFVSLLGHLCHHHHRHHAQQRTHQVRKLSLLHLFKLLLQWFVLVCFHLVCFILLVKIWTFLTGKTSWKLAAPLVVFAFMLIQSCIVMYSNRETESCVLLWFSLAD